MGRVGGLFTRRTWRRDEVTTDASAVLKTRGTVKTDRDDARDRDGRPDEVLWPDPALVDLDLEVAAGQVFGFLGPNGAGKTTTIRLLLDLQRPTRGRASVLGHDAQRDAVEIHATGRVPAR